MNSASMVENFIVNWKAEGHTCAELAVLIAEACIGWPYVWGSLGELCTVSEREKYMNRGSIGEGDRELIRKRCQVLNGSKSSCDGCKYFPGGARTRIFDCRGFTRKVIEWAGAGTIQGAGATSQYNDNSNWVEKGKISDMPLNAVCCVFKQVSGGVMDHTGLHIGGGNIIHCSGEVMRGKTTDRGWTHYAIPKNMQDVPGTDLPTLRRGSRGEYVTLAQTKLYQAGYDLGASGIDGIFGKATENAVKDFQRDHRDADGNPLTADGVIGKKTWYALDGAEPANKYTVTVYGLTESQAEALIKQYPGSKKTEERG